MCNYGLPVLKSSSKRSAFASMLTAASCNEGGAGSIKQSIAGLDWVAGHIKKPAVVLLSLGILDNDLSRSLDQVPACRFQI